MIVVRVELHSARDGNVTLLGLALIDNQGVSAGGELGDYRVRTLRGRGAAQLARAVVQREGKVLGHARKREHVWNLVAKALAGLGYGRRA